MATMESQDDAEKMLVTPLLVQTDVMMDPELSVETVMFLQLILRSFNNPATFPEGTIILGEQLFLNPIGRIFDLIEAFPTVNASDGHIEESTEHGQHQHITKRSRLEHSSTVPHKGVRTRNVLAEISMLVPVVRPENHINVLFILISAKQRKH